MLRGSIVTQGTLRRGFLAFLQPLIRLNEPFYWFRLAYSFYCGIIITSDYDTVSTGVTPLCYHENN